MMRVLVTASRLRLAALLAKGLQLQGWKPCVATTYNAVVDTMRQTPMDLVLVDADFFQTDTLRLVATIEQQQLPMVLLAKDYQVYGYDLRKVVAIDDIFIKPFSTQYLIAVLNQKLTLGGCPPTPEK